MDSTLIKMNCDVSSAFAVIYVKTKGVARIKKNLHKDKWKIAEPLSW